MTISNTLQTQPTATLEYMGDHLIGYIEPIDNEYYRFVVTELPELPQSTISIGGTLTVDRLCNQLHVIGLYTAVDTKGQLDLVKFALKYPNAWHSFADDKNTVELICATVNLRIIEINDCEQFKLRSRFNAELFISNRS